MDPQYWNQVRHKLAQRAWHNSDFRASEARPSALESFLPLIEFPCPLSHAFFVPTGADAGRWHWSWYGGGTLPRFHSSIVRYRVGVILIKLADKWRLRCHKDCTQYGTEVKSFAAAVVAKHELPACHPETREAHVQSSSIGDDTYQPGGRSKTAEAVRCC
ncbi:hypothetical protein Cob_v005731 [Colletotrichum orbiculare MAFF 240422]|uniref:Uncharacterized protein n=1 Tax=Colletotrichum orbiculare (strain 104-T / ATCC 96160 / CBS 514.97 / LARS 414 / MAFF 240422) TaxID=1213857 RepID=A0A484FSS6_COLOR|nr:hypothetical protein Cob_v005731 [Colletotrichum orbiculare MAFF 240422]